MLVSFFDNLLNYYLLVGRRLCCSTVRSLFANEGKHGGEATMETLRLIADHVKTNNCQLHPDSVEVILHRKKKKKNKNKNRRKK